MKFWHIPPMRSTSLRFFDEPINYYGYFTPFGGYGIANFNWVKHLRRQGKEVIPHGKFLPKTGEKEWDILNDEEKEIASIPFERQRIGIIETTPFDFDIIDTEIKIANTMAESDAIGDSWIQQCNKMDYVVVPNEFQYNVFRNAEIPGEKLQIIPHGTETEKFPYYHRPERDIFTFGIAGYLNERKGVFEVIQAFASEFDPDEPVRLLLHSTNLDFGYYLYFSDSRIVTDCVLLSPQDLNKWYKSLDCFVFPSKAEGIGQPPREAMATGLPVILTNYSGLEEIATDDISYPLQPRKLVAGLNPHSIEQPGHWAEIDIQELMYQMRYVYEHQEEAKRKGARAAKTIRARYSWTIAAKKMIQFIDNL